MPTDFERKVASTIADFNMLANCERLVIGLSGGADSVSLLHFIDSFVKKNKLNIQIIPVHVNHGLRGKEAERDEKFAENFCKQLGLNLAIKHIDAKKIALENKISIEEAGRMMRYKIFDEYAVNSNSKIAVAHTLSDSCETLIFNLTRGASIKGLCGIPPVRGNIIRPLIGVTRQEIEKYCEMNGFCYVYDSSNFQRQYTRNKIRLDVIPILKSINPNFEQTVGRLISNLRCDEEFLSDLSQELLDKSKTVNGYNSKIIMSSPKAIRTRTLAKIFSTVSEKPMENKHITALENIIQDGRGAVTICENSSLMCKNGMLKLTQTENTPKTLPRNSWSAKMCIGENILTDTQTNIIIKMISTEDYNKMRYDINQKNVWFIDYDKLPGPCYFRHRNSGDKFYLPKRKVTKTLKKLFSECKIPKEKREEILLLVYENDVIWIEKFGVSQKYIPGNDTQNVLALILESRG